MYVEVPKTHMFLSSIRQGMHAEKKNGRAEVGVGELEDVFPRPTSEYGNNRKRKRRRE